MAEFPPNLTWDEFLSLPQETRNAGLIDGEVVVNPPNTQHEWILSNLHLVFRAWMHGGPNRGVISTQQPVKVHERSGYQPDFLWYEHEHHVPVGGGRTHLDPPSLVVEVLSPSTRRYDLVRKRDDYETVGIPEAWFVSQDPDDYWVLQCQRERPDGPFVDRKRRPGDVLTSPLLPGFEVEVAKLFSDWPL